MKRIAIALAATLVLLTTTSWDIWSWASGNDIEEPSATVTKKTLRLKSFDELTVERGLKVNFTPGKGDPVIVITAPENYHKYLSLKNSNGDLEISLTPKSVNGDLPENFKIELTGGNPDELEASSAGLIIVKGDLTARTDLELSASSAGKIECGNVTATLLRVTASSAGTVNVGSAKATTLKAASSSASSVSITGINAASVSAGSNSAARMTLTGTCTTVSLEASSAASLHAASLKAQKGSAQASSGSSVSCSIKHPDKINSSSGSSVSNN